MPGPRSASVTPTNSPAAQRGGFNIAGFLRSPSDVDIDGVKHAFAAANASTSGISGELFASVGLTSPEGAIGCTPPGS